MLVPSGSTQICPWLAAMDWLVRCRHQDGCGSWRYSPLRWVWPYYHLFFHKKKGRDHRGGRAVHGYSCCLSRENFHFSLRPSAPTWQGFHKLSSTSKPQLVVLMISPTHLPNYPVKSAHRPGCSQSTPNCTFSVEHEWRTWGEVQPECVLVKGTAEDCLWALPRRVAVV